MRGLTDEQLQKRRSGISGSEVATVVAYYADQEGREVPWPLPEYKSALALYRDKVKGPRDRDVREAAEAGLRLEPALLRWYQDETSHDAQELQVTQRHPENRHHIGTPDATDGRRIVELKTVWTREQSDRWSHSDRGVPAEYYLQVQWYMHVLEYDQADIFVLDAGCYGVETRLHELERDQDVIDKCVHYVDRFWHEHVEPKNPPEPDGSRAAAQALDDLAPQDTTNVRLADSEEEASLQELKDLRERKKQLEEEYKRRKQELIAKADDENIKGIETQDGLKLFRDSRGSKRFST